MTARLCCHGLQHPIKTRRSAAARHWIAFAAMTIFLAACSSDPESPEQQIQNLIERLETAAEAKDLGVLRDALSDQYVDDRGYNKRSIVGLLRINLLRNESIYLLTRVKAIGFPVDDQATASVIVAMAGRPIASAEQLLAIDVDMHRFDLTLEQRDDDWQIVGAQWRRASAEEFL
ncbi:MAG: hypothetical protein OES26_07475 [Gammaproteobacteria bacterium]|nr:hypothetical protein [Gammaproteobacteria bacterium]